MIIERLQHGSTPEAASCLGIGLQAAKGGLAQVYSRTGARSFEHMLWVAGWICVPEQYRALVR